MAQRMLRSGNRVRATDRDRATKPGKSTTLRTANDRKRIFGSAGPAPRARTGVDSPLALQRLLLRGGTSVERDHQGNRPRKPVAAPCRFARVRWRSKRPGNLRRMISALRQAVAATAFAADHDVRSVLATHPLGRYARQRNQGSPNRPAFEDRPPVAPAGPDDRLPAGEELALQTVMVEYVERPVEKPGLRRYEFACIALSFRWIILLWRRIHVTPAPDLTEVILNPRPRLTTASCRSATLPLTEGRSQRRQSAGADPSADLDGYRRSPRGESHRRRTNTRHTAFHPPAVRPRDETGSLDPFPPAPGKGATMSYEANSRHARRNGNPLSKPAPPQCRHPDPVATNSTTH